MSQAEFDQQRIAGGYRETYEVDFSERGNPVMHSHDFDALVLVTQGEFTLKFEDRDQVMKAGDLCAVPAGTMHAELCTTSPTIALAAAR